MPMLAFILNYSTLEDVDIIVVNIFDMGNAVEEHIDGQDPFLGEARLIRQGEYHFNSDGCHIPSSASMLSDSISMLLCFTLTLSTSESILIMLASSSVAY
jgi:hypothetical protein